MSTKLLAVTGNPVLHSKSPLIFNTIFQHLGIDAVYGRVAASNAGEAVFLFRELGLTGMNVTAPFKKRIIKHLDHIDEAAAKIGGVNTVVVTKGKLKGFNTDHTGVTQSLTNRGISIGGKNCTVLGAGGAGRAAVYGLLKQGGLVTVVNRTYEKACHAAEIFKCNARPMEELEQLLSQSDILISTLSAAVDIIPGDWLHPRLVVFDANYKKSHLSEKAIQRGCTLIKGEEWLLNSAIPAYWYFLGGEPGDDGLFGKIKEQLLTPAPAPPKHIALVGFMGSGKSACGRALAKNLQFAFKDLDEDIELETGQTIPQIFQTRGEAYFRQLEKEGLRKALDARKTTVFACGGGLVADMENRSLLKENALVIWLYSSVRTALERIRPGSRPLLECDNPAKKAREILTQRMASYADSADLIIPNESSIEEAVEKINDEILNTFCRGH